MGTVCLNTAGKVLWFQRDLAYETPHGNGGSPVLHDDKLLFSCDDSTTPYVVALNANTGEVVWRTERETTASNKFSFSTPIIIDDEDRKLVVSAGSGMVGAYDVEDGTEMWRVRYGNGFSIVPRPVVAHGLIFVTTGFGGSERILAIRLGGRGDVTDTHVVWTSDEGTPHTPSMLAIGDELYSISDQGTFSCVDAVTGQVHWRERIRDKFSASLVYADGRIYATSETGKTLVVQAAKQYKLLAENDLEERTYASPALSGGVLYMRTAAGLYRIETP